MQKSQVDGQKGTVLGFPERSEILIFQGRSQDKNQSQNVLTGTMKNVEARNPEMTAPAMPLSR